MKIEEMLKQQEKRGLKRNVIKAKMQSYDDYVKDDTSPRPYNTPNVLDLFGDGTDYVADIINISENDIKCSISTLGAEIIRDTTSTLYQNAIRDTISTMGSGVIRDTTSTMAQDAIRDTTSALYQNAIRDTISTMSSGVIGGTTSTMAPDAIRDTTSALYQNAIRDTTSTMGSGVIRDTTSTMGLGIIRDRKIVEKTPHTGRPAKGNKYNYSDLSGNARKLVNEIAYSHMMTATTRAKHLRMKCDTCNLCSLRKPSKTNLYINSLKHLQQKRPHYWKRSTAI